jgi:hypothetical protein
VSYIGNSALPFNPLATSGKPRDAQRFNGDNTTTTFTLNFRVDNATDLEVFVDNVQQEPLTAYDALANQLIFTEAPPSGTNNIYVVYRNTDSGIFANIPDGSITFNKLANNIRLFTTDNFTGDGGTTTFNLSSDVPDANTLVVAVDGVFQRAPIHYTASNNTITFSSAPPVSSNVHVRHLGFRTTQTVTALPANTTISQPVLQSPSYTGTLTGGTGEINIGSGQLYKDASGNVGIGTSSPAAKLEVSGTVSSAGLDLNVGALDKIIKLVRGATGTGKGILSFGLDAGSGFEEAARIHAFSSSGSSTNGDIRFYTTGASAEVVERMRIDSSGNLLVGTTSSVGSFPARLEVNGIGTDGRAINTRVNTTGSANHLSFNNPNGQVGFISSSGSSTTYSTSSDYRLKEDWQPMSGAITRLNQLKPVNFAWKVDGSRVDGFLAHEAQEVVPECVTGTKDAVDKNGKPEYQGIDQSKLVPLLTAALQEAVAEINSLKARVEALESNQDTE